MAKTINDIKTGLSNTLDKISNSKVAQGIKKVQEWDKKAGDFYREHSLQGAAAKKGEEMREKFDNTKAGQMLNKAGEFINEHNLASKAGKALGEATNGSRTAADSETPVQTDSPLGGYDWRTRIANRAATDDDIRTAYDEYMKGNYTPGPATMAEFEKMGLKPKEGQTAVDNPEVAQEQAAEQPEQPEQVAEQPVEQPTETPAEQPETNIDGTETVVAPEEAEQVKEELEQKGFDFNKYREDLINDMTAGDEQAKDNIKGIFDAYKKGLIDPATKNYFIIDALAKTAANIGNTMQDAIQNSTWQSVRSGQVQNTAMETPEWNNYLKENWAKAQELKWEGKSQAQKAHIEANSKVLEQIDNANFKANVLPKLAETAEFKNIIKGDPKDAAVTLQTMGYIDSGKPMTAEELSTMIDAAGSADGFAKAQKATYDALIASNDMSAALLVNQQVINANQQAMIDLDKKLKNGQITQQEYDAESKRLGNINQRLQNDLLESTKNIKIDQEKAALNAQKYGGTKIKLNVAIPGTPYGVGAEVDGSTLANLGWDIGDMIKRGQGSISK